MKMKRTIEDEQGKLVFHTGAAATWQVLLNMRKHSYLNQSIWEEEDFEDETNEGIIHLVHGFLTYQGQKPKLLKGNGKADIECEINGIQLSVICIADSQRETVYRYDRQALSKPDGSIRFVADSAESWLLFYEQMFGADANNPENFK